MARVTDNDTSASGGRPRPGFDRVMRMAASGEAEVIVVWAVDRMVRKVADLEDVIERCKQHRVRLVTVSGDLDLSNDQGRLVGRILASVARGEMERKSARQKLAAQQAAASGRRWVGCPRPFGYEADHVSVRPAEAGAIRWAADCLLGGGTVSAVMREWNGRGLASPQSGRPFGRQSVTTIMRNPRLAGLNAYRGEITGPGDWEPVLPEATWRAVDALLADPSRKPPRGVRTLLGGLAACRCGTRMQGSRSYQGNPVYRCNPPLREGRGGPHATVRAAPVDDFLESVILARMSRPDVADLIRPPADTAGLRTEAASIRRNLDELAADRALGLVSRSQMIAATERGSARLAAIAAELADAAGGSALAPFAVARAARDVWDTLDLSRRRAVIDTLAAVTLHPAGRGARTFDPATVAVTWRQP